MEEKRKAEEEKRKQEAIEKERQALLEKTRKEEQKKLEEEAKRQAEMRQTGASKIEPVTPSESEDYTNEKRTETLIDKEPVGKEGSNFKTTEEEDRILKENERNRTAKESSGEDSISSHAQQQTGIKDNSPASNEDPWLPMSPKTETKASDRTSARTERESRRQRCLMHDMLQNKHISTSLVEAEKGEDGAKEQFQTCGQNEVAVVPQEEKADKEKEIAKAKITNETKPNPNLGKPVRPSDLPLNIQQASQKQFSEETNKQNTPPDADFPSVGIIQRYSDHEKLRNKAEKWKEKRQNDASLPESASIPDRGETCLRQDSKEMPPRFGFILKTIKQYHL